MSILHIASLSGNLEFLKYILSIHVFLIDDKSSFGIFKKYFYYTPIHLASTNGYSECVQLLLSNTNANINEITNVFNIFFNSYSENNIFQMAFLNQ